MKKLLLGNWVARLAWLMMLSWPMMGLRCFYEPSDKHYWNNCGSNIFIPMTLNDEGSDSVKYYINSQCYQENGSENVILSRSFKLMKKTINDYDYVDSKLLFDTLTSLGRLSTLRIGLFRGGCYFISNANMGNDISKLSDELSNNTFQLLIGDLYGKSKQFAFKSTVGPITIGPNPDTAFGQVECFREVDGGYLAVNAGSPERFHRGEKLGRYFFDVQNKTVTALPVQNCLEGGILVDQQIEGIDTLRICKSDEKGYVLYAHGNVIVLDNHYRKCFYDAFYQSPSDSALLRMRYVK